jgi:hypothetical protein
MFRGLHLLGVKRSRSISLGSRCRYERLDELRILARKLRSGHLRLGGPVREPGYC